MKGIVLVVVQGPDAGRSFAVPLGAFRVLGRHHGLLGGTTVVTQGDKRRLEREDETRIAEHLRARAVPGHGARAEASAFERLDDVELADEAVSQTHAIVFCDEAGASVVDVASTNGTFVNNDKVADAPLVVGDLVRVGETRLAVKPA